MEIRYVPQDALFANERGSIARKRLLTFWKAAEYCRVVLAFIQYMKVLRPSSSLTRSPAYLTETGLSSLD